MIKTNNSDQKKWESLGLSLDWFAKDPEGANYLIRSRLIYSIVGFNFSAQDQPALRLTERGLEILKEGQFVSVTQAVMPHYFRRVFGGGGKLVERQANKAWTYLGTGKGFVPVDRWKHTEFISVAKINSMDQEELLKHAFHQNLNANHRCVVQVVTQPRGIVGTNNPLTRNFHLYKPVHASLRIIDAEGNVYST